MNKSDIHKLALVTYRNINDNERALEVINSLNYPKLMDMIAMDMFAYPEKYDPDDMIEFRLLYVEFQETGLIPKQIRS